ncbi:similar to Saccharomyces cerevisiae YCR051W Putative protein of unknown function [Maudiozyma barnettii]|uniref:Ankyrin repeat-containing protein YCR051W n=1 Tax=Maudiozyma barnettii TaxID=61262 RepID=A0A8H2VBL6_9SACH|nr:hypothetical protein [Kazachstania barnettii]CAB4252277.1 similar to Saccharomyces cerevisiae YCR051W Putative protein of unknown function [Kazachstania barnettii]CAD1778973.1 similar to Saccharomyces cerevisiae YCR051W Putative protein of unknown function [Kazachstania barnettii]
MNIWIAASDGRSDLVEKFIAENPSITANTPDLNGYTAMHAAASYGHIDLLRRLTNEFGGNVNVKDNDGDTPLHHTEDLNTAKVLIEELGCDLNITNSEGKTALQVTEEDQEFPELIQYLRQKSGVPIEQDSLGIDANMMAEFKDNIRYTLENDRDEDLDSESLARKKKLEQIIQGGNAEEELEVYIRDLVRSKMMSSDEPETTQDEPDSKRRK